MQSSIFCAGLKPGNMEGCSKNGIQPETLGDSGIILSLLCVAASSQLVVTQ